MGLAERAEAGTLALLCVPPPGREPARYGDVAPLGLLRRALLAGAAATGSDDLSDAAGRVGGVLERRRQGLLWPYHQGAIVTSIDSALVLLGVSDPAAVAALEEFRAGDGYLPQSTETMGAQAITRHWCQPDYSIACLVRHLRRQAGLDPGVPLAYLERGFDTRSGLYIANPLVLDWLLALAIEGDPLAEPLRRRLADEIRGARNADGSYGGFDPMTSTASALLALAALGQAPDGAARERLEALWDTRAERPSECPFYSTHLHPWSSIEARELMSVLLADEQGHLLRAAGEEHVATFYVDTEGVVVHSLVALSLLDDRPPGPSHAAEGAHAHERYRCRRVSEYVSRHALVPYAGAPAAA
jgi:hypothetical protein